MRRISYILLSICFLTCFSSTFAQSDQNWDASKIKQALKKLPKTTKVLYVAAHPDDENTRLIAYLSNEMLLETAYLSLTRGDGGQNLIGSEIGEQLGLIRTQELLQARRIDGGKQFFSRAKDFGYSKHPDETFKIWDRNKVLSDVVWVIRKFRPDVIITRFSTEPGVTHGHHTASAILAEEAFDLAADPNSYPDQLQYVDTWQAQKLFWNTSWFFFRNTGRTLDQEGLLKINVGKYNPLLGKSYSEIAAASRTMHKSQGFGSTGNRAENIEYLKFIKGTIPAGNSILDGVTTNKKAAKLGDILASATSSYNMEQPANLVPALLNIRKALQRSKEPLAAEKLVKLDQVIIRSLGLYLEAKTSQETATPGEEVAVGFELTNRSATTIKLLSIEDPYLNQNIMSKMELSESRDFFSAPPEKKETQYLLSPMSIEPYKTIETKTTITIPENAGYSDPYWINSGGSIGMFEVNDRLKISNPESIAAASYAVSLEIGGQEFEFMVPVNYKRNDPVDGEQINPFQVLPPVFIKILKPIVIFPDNGKQELEIEVTAGKEQVQGQLSLQMDKGWSFESDDLSFNLEKKGSSKKIKVVVNPPSQSSTSPLTVSANVGNESYDITLSEINYDHIPNQKVLNQASSKLVRIDFAKSSGKIGYIDGAGDDVFESLQKVGYECSLIKMDELGDVDLSQFKTILVGIRAYNTQSDLKFHQEKLMDYVNDGGTLIVQYNTSRGLVLDELGPYPLKLSRDRVTVEEAEVRFLKPQHPVLNQPNKLGPNDFENWVQERGLYFPSEWDPKYQAILSMNDPGETAKDGSLLVSQHGKGHYVYTGISFFRELPAGVPGAYRLLANLIALGQ